MRLQKNGWYGRFPPPGVEVVSWYVELYPTYDYRPVWEEEPRKRR